MKNFLIFIAGMLTGVVLLSVFSLSVQSSSTEDENIDDGITIFSEPGECVSNNPFKIIQVLDSGNALAVEQEKMKYSNDYLPGDLTVLFINNGDKYYYDDQFIKIPAGSCVKQIGIYKYMTNSLGEKTVPIVEILNK